MSEMRDRSTHDDSLVREVLSAAGWTTGRAVDAATWAEALRADGYTVSRAAEGILAQYGGLSFRPPFREGARSGPETISFVPLAETARERARIAVRERQLGRRLCPVGEWWDGEYMLLVADDGHVFAETSYQVLDLGRSMAEALRQMIVRDEPLRDITDQLPAVEGSSTPA